MQNEPPAWWSAASRRLARIWWSAPARQAALADPILPQERLEELFNNVRTESTQSGVIAGRRRDLAAELEVRLR
jgi:hypothetical protein